MNAIMVLNCVHQDTNSVERVDRPEETLQTVESHHLPLVHTHTQGSKSSAHCFCLLGWQQASVTRSARPSSLHRDWRCGPLDLAPMCSSANPLVSAAFLLEPQSLQPSPNPATELASPVTPFRANDRSRFSKNLQRSFVPHMKVKSSENYSQNAIIDPNALLQFHSPFSHIHFWPCQIRRLVSCPGGFSLKSQLLWHPLCFPGKHRAPHTDAGWPWICPHCYCLLLHLPHKSIKQKSMLSERVTAWLSCLLLSCLCSLFRYSLHHRARHAFSLSPLMSWSLSVLCC